MRKAGNIRVGDPLEHETQMGPVISPTQANRILTYCQRAEEEGAELVAGGKRITEGDLAAGNFLAPTVFDGVRPDMHLAQEEVFGPVLAVIPFTEDEVVQAANSTIYGLAATIWTTTSSAPTPWRGACRPATSASTTRRSTRPRRPSAATSRAAGTGAEPPRHGSLHPDQERGGESQSAAVRLVRLLARAAKAVTDGEPNTVGGQRFVRPSAY